MPFNRSKRQEDRAVNPGLFKDGTPRLLWEALRSGIPKYLTKHSRKNSHIEDAYSWRAALAHPGLWLHNGVTRWNALGEDRVKRLAKWVKLERMSCNGSPCTSHVSDLHPELLYGFEVTSFYVRAAVWPHQPQNKQIMRTISGITIS